MYNATYNTEGTRSKFYIIDKKRGFKTFGTKQCAETARYVQRELAAYDLAPNVLSEVGRIRLSKKNKRLSNWGFITELAKMIGCNGKECDCGHCSYIEEELSGAITELCDKIENCCGFYFGDCHIGNVGYVRRNRKKVLVCIDTGEESIDTGYDSYSDDNDCSCNYCRDGV